MKQKIISAALLAGMVCPVANGQYEPTWESLSNYEAPEWYEDAKLGFWPIWGVYSVPAFKGDHAAEWYGRWMYCQEGQSSSSNQGLATHLHHKETYGDPGTFGYKDLIPMWKAEKFEPDDWADLCVKGGAKFFTMIAVFSDNFCQWDSEVSRWNSVDMGPKRDIVGELKVAMHKKGLKYGVSNHSGWGYNFFLFNHINGYDAKDLSLKDLYGAPIIPDEVCRARINEGEAHKDWLARTRYKVSPSQYDLDEWLARTKELATLYTPDLYYFDWGIHHAAFEPYIRDFGAHYYNLAVESGMGEFGSPQVVINHKRPFRNNSAVRDFERGGMKDIADRVWQTDDSIYYGNNWSYDPNVVIKPTDMIVDQLMDIISKRGVLMLAIAPKADGTFPEDQKKMICELGAWLDACGEAVYATRPYEVLGEVSDTWYDRDDHYHLKFEGKPDDIRFTRNKANTVLYATFLEWPGDKAVIKTLKGVNLSGVKSVKLLGKRRGLTWCGTKDGLEIRMPKKAPKYGMAYPVRIEFRGRIPSPSTSEPLGLDEITIN
ncbi:alpha-L-fucosidase [Pontiella sulfatireligans]|nr:alpha-L-fucosidase [Pontiella sulfatireligans]